jgi:hypothetical protein
MFGKLKSCSKKEKSLCDFKRRSILVGLKKKKKKSIPTDPNFEDHAIGNTHIFFLALSLSCISTRI